MTPIATKAAARWRIAEPPRGTKKLAFELGVSELAARVLASRGFTSADAARKFLAPSIADLHDPMLMRGMREGVDRLTHAIAARERILIYGDYDVDGTTSIVILKKAIELAGGEAEFHIPHRLRDGYGMRPEVVERAAERGVTLIVSVDTGIRAAETVRRASELGIDSIVTDHHLPEAELPPAFAVLNPNQPLCEYPEKNLCGVGVAFKLVQALLATTGWPREKTARTLESFLKLVAIGTVADVVPLTGENRVIVRHGLKGLDDVRNPGLRALLDIAGFPAGTAPTSSQVAFRVAPRINAAGRMDTATDVIDMFLATDPALARDLAKKLHDLNADRQLTEQSIVAMILEECQRTPVTNESAALVFCGENWHRGVLGICASRVVERFHRPVFVLGSNPDDGTATGSGRSISTYHLLNALESMSDLFVKFGGHEHAAGLTLDATRVDEFRRRFNAYALERLTPDDFVAEIAIDTEARLDELTDAAVKDLFAMAPFGHGNRPPMLICRDAEVAGPVKVMKEKHLKIPLRQGSRVVWMKAWNFVDRAAELVPGRRVDVAFKVEEDSYSGWSGTIEDVRPA